MLLGQRRGPGSPALISLPTWLQRGATLLVLKSGPGLAERALKGDFNGQHGHSRKYNFIH